MSLINDALKRAKKAQQENPPPTPPLQFRPVEPGQEGRPRSPLILVAAVLGLTMIVGMGGLLIWVVAQQHDASLQVEAKAIAPVDPPPAPLRVEPAPAPASTPEEVMTNTLPAVAAEEPKAPELKLQGIFFNPRSPSAVVNGKTVYVGDKVSGFRVFAITPQNVTLGTATQTNVLDLSP
ncbi:MAG: hypothetical protein U1F83_11550 [Verrucomicrobiota bacterium]